MNYQHNKQLAIYNNSDPSLTDQSQGKDTDINVIVARALRTGVVPTKGKEPMYVDSSQLPEDLRSFIETATKVNKTKNALPEALRKLSTEEILSLTPEQLTNIITPPVIPPAGTETKP